MLRSLIFLIVMAGVLPARSEACSCTAPDPPLEALASATAVFTGRILAAEPDGGNGYAYTIEVYAVWKGPLAPTVVVANEDLAALGEPLAVSGEDRSITLIKSRYD